MKVVLITDCRPNAIELKIGHALYQQQARDHHAGGKSLNNAIDLIGRFKL
jgi:hypothetical protein